MKKEYILPLKDLVIHPGLTIPVSVDNPVSIACIDAAMDAGQTIVLAPQRSWTYPNAASDIYDVATIGKIVQLLRLPDGDVHIIIHTTAAVNLSEIEINNGVFSGAVTPIQYINDETADMTLSLRDCIMTNLQSISNNRKFKTDKIRNIITNYPLPAFVDYAMQLLEFDTESAIQILRTPSWTDKLVAILEQAKVVAETSKIEDTITRRVHQQMENGRRDAILHEKMRAIQREMGEDNEEMDTENIRRRIEKTPLPADAREKAMSEWRRMRNLSPMSNEGGLLKAYLEELLAMPWGKKPAPKIDLTVARKTLDAGHSGMQPIKERILEHIAVMKKTGSTRGTVMCLVGAPGVGKTSLCKSVADALGRKYQRISLGGISDEAHFRGHRKTYIGAQTGRIMDALKRCHANNPVIVLDEIDKMGRDYRGDPEAALLEITDPEQNKSFRDHYLEVDFDLSNVVFIATANSLNMSSALKDRMEIIEIPGYSEDEKVQIAREHIIARAANDTGWDVANIVMDDDAIRHLIRNYTSEQGVRQLQREITALLRRSLLENDCADVRTEFTPAKIDELLSIRKSAGLSKRIGFGAAA